MTIERHSATRTSAERKMIVLRLLFMVMDGSVVTRRRRGSEQGCRLIHLFEDNASCILGKQSETGHAMIGTQLEDQGSEIAGVEFGWRIRMQFLCRIVTVPEDQASRFKRQDVGRIEFVAAISLR